MIIISRNLVLSDQYAEVDPNAPRIGYRTLATFGNVVADSENILYPVSNLTNVATSSFWRSESAGVQYVYVTPGLNSGVDYIGFANHNLGSAGISYQVEGSDDGSVWTPISDEVIPGDDTPHVQLFVRVTYGAYRVKFTPSTSVVPQIAIMYLGRILSLPRNIYVGHIPITMGRETSMVNNKTENGQFLGRIIRRQYLQTTVKMQNISPSWVRTYLLPFMDAAEATPFFWSWRPQRYPREVGYCWTTDDIHPENQRNNGMMSFSMKIQGIGKYILIDREGDDYYETST
jgi:hypothetical protein